MDEVRNLRVDKTIENNAKNVARRPADKDMRGGGGKDDSPGKGSGV